MTTSRIRCVPASGANVSEDVQKYRGVVPGKAEVSIAGLSRVLSTMEVSSTRLGSCQPPPSSSRPAQYDFAAVNEVYTEYLGDAKPARSTVAVAELPRGALVEIDFVALV